jgi:hypothetical protein
MPDTNAISHATEALAGFNLGFRDQRKLGKAHLLSAPFTNSPSENSYFCLIISLQKVRILLMVTHSRIIHNSTVRIHSFNAYVR